ncbi:MAG: DegV family EDD domain-containing protein, partial [Lachnospiraceae bacterium]|nr:DegV family EDD domain-containing protein [Lachnospiraceae bacterium]
VQCAHRIREILNTEGRSCAMVALTANAVSGAREMFAWEGFDAFVAKPVERTELTRALHHVLSREAAQENREAAEQEPVPFTWRRESEALSGIIDGTEREDAYEAPVIMTPHGTKEAASADDTREEAQTPPAKRRVRITCDSACDLPAAWYDEWDIAVMHHILHTKTGSFLDGEEINGDELVLYIKAGAEARSEVPGTIAFARFFTEQLAHADEVIHISIADASSPVYKFAEASLKRIEGVTLVDSGLMSGGAGLLVLYAAYLAKETELHADAILTRLKKVKSHITARFVLENTGALLAGGRISPVTSRWLDAFMLHPTIDMRNSMMQFFFIWSGAYSRRFIRRVLRRKWRIDTSLLMITHAGLSVAALSEIREEVEKHVHFDRVIVMATSSAIAVNVGAGTFGLQFHTLSGDRETGGRLFDFLPEEV